MRRAKYRLFFLIVGLLISHLGAPLWTASADPTVTADPPTNPSTTNTRATAASTARPTVPSRANARTPRLRPRGVPGYAPSRPGPMVPPGGGPPTEPTLPSVGGSGSTVIKVYNFNAVGDGYSRRFQPEWDYFTNIVQTDPRLSNVQTYDIKCDQAASNAVCNQFQVRGYPSIIFEINGVRTEYDGNRSYDALLAYLGSVRS